MILTKKLLFKEKQLLYLTAFRIIFQQQHVKSRKLDVSMTRLSKKRLLDFNPKTIYSYSIGFKKNY